MKILHLLTAGGLGGIEILTHDIGVYSSHENAFCFLFGTGKTYDRMRDEGMTVYDLTRYKNKISIQRYLELCRIAENYDVIVVHHGDPNLKLYYALVKTKNKKQGITYIHSCWDETLFFPHNPVKHWIGKFLFQKAMDVSDRIVFVSNAGMNSYAENFRIDGSKARVIYNGIGVEKQNAEKQNGRKGHDKINITYVGRIEGTKGIDILLEAFQQLEDTDTTLNIVGEGSKLNQYKNWATANGLAERVQFHGAQVNVIPYLEQADVFVYPSTCQEVFGISIVEAMAFGCICVANSVGGIPEVIKNGENGYLTEQCSAKGLLLQLKKAISLVRSGNTVEMQAKARETAKRFTIQNTCSELDKMIVEMSHEKHKVK